MDEDKRGTWQDWPALWIVLGGLLMFLGVVAGGAQGLVALGWLLVIFGGISMAVRRGAFSPRQRP